jgi:methionyl aminopeptidase
MESHEVTINGKTHPVRPVRNICAHDIKQFRIHGSKQIPFIKNNDQTKMEEGEIFAIETFGTTGRGYLRDDVGVYGYGVSPNAPKQVNLPLASAGKLYKTIRENFGSLVFCRRYLEHIDQERYLAGVSVPRFIFDCPFFGPLVLTLFELNCLVNNGVLDSYAPLVDIKGSYSAQFEHVSPFHCSLLACHY